LQQIEKFFIKLYFYLKWNRASKNLWPRSTKQHANKNSNLALQILSPGWK